MIALRVSLFATTLCVGLGVVLPANANSVTAFDLGNLGYLVAGDVWGINATGQVVGASYLGINLHAFATGNNGVGMINLGTLGGRDSVANGINDSGLVSLTGDSEFASLTAANAVVIPPGGSVTVYSAQFWAYDAAVPDSAAGNIKLNAKTELLE